VNPVVRNKIYYGVTKEIIELNYGNKGNIVLFKCDWIDNRVQGRWVKTDQFGITSVNLKLLFNTGERLLDEPFIFPSQAMQVCYVLDRIHKDWASVVQSKPHHFYDMAVVDDENEQQKNGIRHWRPELHTNVDLNLFLSGVHVRTDIHGIIVNEKRGSKYASNFSLRSKCKFSNLSACLLLVFCIPSFYQLSSADLIGIIFQDKQWWRWEEKEKAWCSLRRELNMKCRGMLTFWPMRRG
jgi:hypothetical protein